MQDSGWMNNGNPFAAGSSNLGRKRDADESGMDMTANGQQIDTATPAHAHAAHGVMPLPKRRIVSCVPF